MWQQHPEGSNVDGSQSVSKNFSHVLCSLEFPPLPQHRDVKSSHTYRSAREEPHKFIRDDWKFPPLSVLPQWEGRWFYRADIFQYSHPSAQRKWRESFCASLCLLFSRQHTLRSSQEFWSTDENWNLGWMRSFRKRRRWEEIKVKKWRNSNM